VWGTGIVLTNPPRYPSFGVLATDGLKRRMNIGLPGMPAEEVRVYYRSGLSYRSHVAQAGNAGGRAVAFQLP